MPFCYETIFILHPDLDDEAVEAAKGRVAEAIAAAEGRIYRRENWGRKRLAYTVAKQNRGNYQLIQYVADGRALGDLERLFRLDDAFLKYLTVKLRKDPATVSEAAPEEVTRDTETASDRPARPHGRGRGRDTDDDDSDDDTRDKARASAAVAE